MIIDYELLRITTKSSSLLRKFSDNILAGNLVDYCLYLIPFDAVEFTRPSVVTAIRYLRLELFTSLHLKRDINYLYI